MQRGTTPLLKSLSWVSDLYPDIEQQRKTQRDKETKGSIGNNGVINCIIKYIKELIMTIFMVTIELNIRQPFKQPLYLHSYLKDLMLLSYVMLTIWFVSQMLGRSYMAYNQSLRPSNDPYITPNRKPPDPAMRRHKKNKFKRLSKLALLAALNVANDLPTIDFKLDKSLKTNINKNLNSYGLLNTTSLTSDKNSLYKLRAYLEHITRNQNVFDDNDLFYLIVDTGCSITATPCKDDFIEYIQYREPITLKGIGGDLKVTHGGIA